MFGYVYAGAHQQVDEDAAALTAYLASFEGEAS